jgi:hypothetical protein
MKFRKTRSRSARRSARKTRRERKTQHQRKRKSQRKSQRGGSIFYDNRVIPDDAYVTEQTDPSSTPVLIEKSELKEIQETI